VSRCAAAAADLGHVPAVAANGPAAPAARFAGLFWREFVCVSAFVGRPSPLAGDLALLFPVHRGEAASSCSHFEVPFLE
jgi:hypothetical protein